MEKFKHRMRLRWPYLMMYVCLSMTGLIVALSPTDSVKDQLQFFLVIWIVFFIVGGVASAVGIILGSWTGEAVGLPLLATALGVYAVILFVRYFGPEGGMPGLLAFAFMLLGFAGGVLGRWLEVLKFLRVARELPNGR